jgi:tetratricopeptide (TPR) repeat protein
MAGNPPEHGIVDRRDAGSTGAPPEPAAQPVLPLSATEPPAQPRSAEGDGTPRERASGDGAGAAAASTAEDAEAAGRSLAPLDLPRSAEAAPGDPPHAAEHPRGASGSDVDRLRATVKVTHRRQWRASSSGQASRPRAPAPMPPSAALHGPELLRLLDEGRELLDLDPKAAHDRFEAAYRRNLNDVRVLSFYGLTLVLVEGDRQRGIRFCEEAVRRGPLTTEMLVNLAKALVLTRNKEQAVRALRKAQELAPDDPRVSSEFVTLGLRRPPPISWLPRSFFLNRWIGKLTWRMNHARGTSLTPLR